MKTWIRSMIALLMTLFLTSPAGAQQLEPVPTWDTRLPVEHRFEGRFLLIQGHHGAYVDRETGLVWMARPFETAMPWRDAVEECRFLSLGGRGGWRLPAVEELTSLLPLPDHHPFPILLIPVHFWSRTTGAASDTQAYSVNGSGEVFAEDKSVMLGVTDLVAWCVRVPPDQNSQAPIASRRSAYVASSAAPASIRGNPPRMASTAARSSGSGTMTATFREPILRRTLSARVSGDASVTRAPAGGGASRAPGDRSARRRRRPQSSRPWGRRLAPRR